jgi:uncharacterized protein YeeX (DUF496 family)
LKVLLLQQIFLRPDFLAQDLQNLNQNARDQFPIFFFALRARIYSHQLLQDRNMFDNLKTDDIFQDIAQENPDAKKSAAATKPSIVVTKNPFELLNETVANLEQELQQISDEDEKLRKKTEIVNLLTRGILDAQASNSNRHKTSARQKLDSYIAEGFIPNYSNPTQLLRELSNRNFAAASFQLSQETDDANEVSRLLRLAVSQGHLQAKDILTQQEKTEQQKRDDFFKETLRARKEEEQRQKELRAQEKEKRAQEKRDAELIATTKKIANATVTHAIAAGISGYKQDYESRLDAAAQIILDEEIEKVSNELVQETFLETQTEIAHQKQEQEKIAQEERERKAKEYEDKLVADSQKILDDEIEDAAAEIAHETLHEAREEQQQARAAQAWQEENARLISQFTLSFTPIKDRENLRDLHEFES